MEFDISEILAEVRAADFLAGGADTTGSDPSALSTNEVLTAESPLAPVGEIKAPPVSIEASANVSAPASTKKLFGQRKSTKPGMTKASIPAAVAADTEQNAKTPSKSEKLSRLPPPNVTEIYELPAHPTAGDYARSVFSHIEKQYGHIPAKTLPGDPTRKLRSGELIHNRQLETPAAPNRKDDFFSKASANRKEAQHRREERKRETELRIELRKTREDEEAARIHNDFFDVQPKEEQTDTVRLSADKISAAAAVAPSVTSAERASAYSGGHTSDAEAMSLSAVRYRYATGADGMRLRTWISSAIWLVMLVITLLDAFEGTLPLWLTANEQVFTAVFIIGQLMITGLGLNVMFTGIADLIKFKPGAESVVAASGIFALADAIAAISSNGGGFGLPFSITASAAMIMAMWGIRLGKSAFSLTLKTAAEIKSPTAVFAEWEKVDNGLVLSKSELPSDAKAVGLDSFMFKATRSDRAEEMVSRFAPLLLMGELVFAILCCVVQKDWSIILRVLAALSSGAAAFSTLSAFNLPFNNAVKRLAKKKAVLAAWDGAYEIAHSVGLVIKDNDIFRGNELRLSSFKVATDHNAEQVVLCAGSLAMASGSSLGRVFTGLLEEYGLHAANAEAFEAHDGGGVSAIINGTRVLMGTEAFIRLMDVQLGGVPKISGAVYLALNGDAAAVFIVQYTPSDKIQRTLLKMERGKIHPLLATRDFNITPTFLRSKFKIELNDLEYPSYPERFILSDTSEPPKAKPAAILSKDELADFTDAADAGKNVYNNTVFATNICAAASIAGLLLMTLFCYNGAFINASPLKALIFHAVMAVIALGANSVKN